MSRKKQPLTLEEAAQILGVSKVTLRRWTNAGIIPFIRVGMRGDRRFYREDLERYIVRRTHAHEFASPAIAASEPVDFAAKSDGNPVT